MISRVIQSFLFIVTSVIQVTIVDARDYVIPAEVPKGCIELEKLPCAVTTGDRPRMFDYSGNKWELDRNIVLQSKVKNEWNVYSGMLVLNSLKQQKIHTPFADVFIGKSKVMLHVLENRVRVMVLDGEGVKVIAKGDPVEHFIVPGFQNWFGGVVKGQSESGVVSVIEFEDYAQKRAKFFLDHQLGFVKELSLVATRVKWAAKMAARMHRDLVERKMASLEEQHQDGLRRKRKKIQFNNYLRKLFLQKIRYDY